MNITDALMLDTEALRNKTSSELCDVIENLLTIIRDQDHTIQLQNEIIASLEDR